ncbi:MAG: beta-galactosidase trimerization domain-containing protein [Coriobacteriia bacterium]|nr:beta-galactosidase trimerization domain-containing protein [Coriobacteriia bacterium]
MPTRKGGPRQPRQRIEREEVSPASIPRRATAQAAAAGAPAKALQRNPLFPVGVSLYPLDAETQGPDDWYERDQTEDIDSLAEARCALVRVFVSWRVLEPQVGQYSLEALGRLADLVSTARAKKMQSVVCLFADDRHAELSDVSWGKRRDPRTDAYLLQREVALAQKVASHLQGEPGVFAWQLGNEAFLSGFESAEELEAWVGSLREAIREVDAKRPIGLGADAETLLRSSGVDARAALEPCEFAVSHLTAAYRAYAAEGPLTSGPSTYLDAFLLRAAHRGRPVLLDEIGTLTLEHSATEEAAYVRTALWSGLMNRAGGAMVRRYRDMDTERREPYFVDPFETLVGIADSEGVPKPVFTEIAKFVRTVARIDLKTHALIAERTAIVVPAERYEPLPSLAGLYDPRACLHAFVLAKQAHVPVAVIREDDEFEAYSVIVVPSAFELSDQAWERVSSFVQGGGTVLMSYGGGDAHTAIRDLFGVEFLGDAGPRPRLSCRVAQADLLGALESFDAQFEVPNHALLSGGTATVVATDAKGSPLLTVNQVGQGRAVYMAVPLERAIAQGDAWATPEPVLRMAREVYGAVARAAGCGAPVECAAPDVEVALLQGETDDVLILLNHSPAEVSAGLVTERRVASIADVRGGAPVAVGGTAFAVPLDGNAATALRITYA